MSPQRAAKHPFPAVFIYFCTMKRLLLLLLLMAWGAPWTTAYNDHRGHNLDSLERAVARWTPDAVDNASVEELIQLNRAYRDLMLGYQQLNQEKFIFYARKALQISQKQGWNLANADAQRYIGQYFYSHEQYDSALVYYNRSLEVVDRMAAGETSLTSDQPYDEVSVDDSYSLVYGAIGNTYSMMDSISVAMEYYRRAGELFEKHGWLESCAILWGNMGETWREEGNLKEAKTCYDKCLDYAMASGDSLQISFAMLGLAAYYHQLGRNNRALSYYEKAYSYYSQHEDLEFKASLESLGGISGILADHKRLWRGLAMASLLLVVVLLSMLFVLRKMDRLRKEKEGADAAIEQALEEQSTPEEGESVLTERENQVLRLIAEGLTSPQIADKICLSLPTIKWYRKKLMIKLDAANTAELISKAKEKRLV